MSDRPTETQLTEADEIEVVSPPSLTSEQEILVDLHSVLNMVAVLATCLELLDFELGGTLATAREKVDRTFELIRDQAANGHPVTLDTSLPHVVQAAVESALARNDGQELSKETTELTGTLQGILDVFEVRAAELQARSGRFHEWARFETRDLTASLQQVLAAIQQNARGRYRIVRNIAQQSPSDYLIQFEISSDEGPTLRMPPVLQDVFRDLVANARKYSAPGGRIAAGIHASPWGIRIVVEDNGIGIPREELDKVVGFGYRASNAADQRTMGGGFGLTKAHWVASQFGGRLWLRSKPNVGTRVTILIPAPKKT